MNRELFFVLLSIYLCSSSPILPPDFLDHPDHHTVTGCGTSKLPPNMGPRIAGGKFTRPGEYPWMVSFQLTSNGKHFCGGSLITENWIVTAAHCVMKHLDNPDGFEVLVGLYKLSEVAAPNVKHMKVLKIVPFADYNNVTYKNDIALVKISEPVNIAKSKGFVNAICMPCANTLCPEGNAKVIGWGRKSYNETTNTDILSEAQVPIVPNDLCNEAYDIKPDDGEKEVSDTMICAGDGDKDACMNDSGGPLFQTSEDGVSTVIGIVSHGSACGTKQYPGVYTKIASFIPWIQMIIQSH